MWGSLCELSRYLQTFEPGTCLRDECAVNITLVDLKSAPQKARLGVAHHDYQVLLVCECTTSTTEEVTATPPRQGLRLCKTSR
jgi:hypothetical protein